MLRSGKTSPVSFPRMPELWLDETLEGTALHDWDANNPWRAQADARSEATRKSVWARWDSVRLEQAGCANAGNITEQWFTVDAAEGGTEARKNNEAPLPMSRHCESNKQVMLLSLSSPTSPNRKAKNTAKRADAKKKIRKRRKRQGSDMHMDETAPPALRGWDPDSENAPPDTAIAKEVETVLA